MASELGIKHKPKVLPMSNMCGYLTPYILSPDLAFVQI